jgi:two-component system LytT family sensor kinase
MEQPSITRPRVIFGVATLLGCFSAFQASQVVRLFYERSTPFGLLLGLNLSYWWAWALLTPLVLWMARRFPFERGAWRKSLPIHLVAVLVITFLHVVMADASRYLLVTTFWEPESEMAGWWTRIARNFFMSFDWEMATYWAIIGFYYAATYHRQAQDRTLKASRLETQLAEAQLQALQRQLHPHFLFNTLNAISALMHRDVEAADQMLSRLSDLLRIALDQPGAQEITLKEELEFLQKYLEIEQTRFGDRLSVSFDIDPITLDARVPNLLLQPLVENSVRHAVAVRIEPGFIAVKARREDGRLQLAVQDNGPGLPKGRLATPGKGVGLANTRSRLEHLYGSDQRLAFSEPAGGGLIVSVAIPFHADEVAEDYNEDFKGVA